MSRKVILYIATSLDGYIADINGNINWLKGDGSDSNNNYVSEDYNSFISNIDTVLLGFSTYEQIITDLSPNYWVYCNCKSYVFTSKNLVSELHNIEFTNKSPESIVKYLKSIDGKDIFVCGGAKLSNSLISENLIDEYHITIIPTILGDGIRLFSNDNPQLKLKLLSTKSFNGMVKLVYKLR